MSLLSTLHDHAKRLDALTPQSRTIVQVVDKDGVVLLQQAEPQIDDQVIKILAGKGYLPEMPDFHTP